MSTTSYQQLPPLAKAFFEQVTKRHAPDAQIALKSKSWLMKLIGVVLKPFNPDFMSSYITTIGRTIYVPEDFFQEDPRQCLSVIAHETQHIIDYQKNPVLFTVGYLFPQCLSLISLLAFLGIFFKFLVFSYFFLALGFLAPIPAPYRYKSELNGYRVSVLVGRFVYHYTEQEMEQIRTWIKSQMTTGNYYFAWPFSNKIDRDLKDESFISEPRYQEILEFLRVHHLTS